MLRYLLAFIRSCIHGVWMAISTIVYALAIVMCGPFASSHRLYRMARSWCIINIKAARWICGVNYQITGQENLPSDPNVKLVFLIKHQSTMETFMANMLIDRDVAFVFKKEILKIPFFGWGIGRLDMIHIDRGNSLRAFSKVIAQGHRILNKGIAVIFFPEGTRTARGEVGNYKLGGTRLAVETGASVVPVAVSSAKCWPRKAFVKYPGMVDVVIGKPIPSEGRTAANLMEEVKQVIETTMHRIDPDAYQVLTTSDHDVASTS